MPETFDEQLQRLRARVSQFDAGQVPDATGGVTLAIGFSAHDIDALRELCRRYDELKDKYFRLQSRYDELRYTSGGGFGL
jgi:hypothetical protein